MSCTSTRRTCTPATTRWTAGDVALVATFAGTRALERRLKRWHKTAQFLPYTRRWVAANALRRSSLGTWDRLIL
jgi:hypothetical protein